MGFFAGLTLCFSACLTVEGLMPRVVCVLLFLPASLTGWFAPRWLAPLFAASFLLRAVALGGALQLDMEERGLILFALSAAVAAALSFLGREKLTRAFLPCGLLLLPFLGFCMAGKWTLPDAVLACPPEEMLLALVCPLSGAFLVPRVKNRGWTPAGVLIGGVFGILSVFVSFPVWEGVSALASSVVAMAMELGMLCRRAAYTYSRRDAYDAAKRNPAGNRTRR
jgi:hypothetical protein